MHFLAVARICRSPDEAVSLRDVWTINDEEMSRTGEVVCERLRTEKQLTKLHTEVAWSAQALIEFADLAGPKISGEGRFQYRNYLYFEGVSALREASIAILGGSPRAATALLRSVMEMLLLHCWWQKQIERENSTSEFYDWLEGQRRKPDFNDIVRNNFDWLGIPPEGGAMEHVNDVYRQLCSYVHPPIRKDSYTMLSGGNVERGAVPVLRHWFVLARDVLRIVLEQLIHLHPQCLFPVDINRKFGFNPPVGMYFDKFNFVPLMAVFGDETISAYRKQLQDNDFVEGIMRFYESRPDLTHEQILESWDNSEEDDIPADERNNPVALWFYVKAEMRLIAMMLTYTDPIGRHW